MYQLVYCFLRVEAIEKQDPKEEFELPSSPFNRFVVFFLFLSPGFVDFEAVDCIRCFQDFFLTSFPKFEARCNLNIHKIGLKCRRNRVLVEEKR